MSQFFDPSEYLCWMTGGERKKKYAYVPPVRTEKGQFAKKVRNPQVGKRGVKHPAILRTND